MDDSISRQAAINVADMTDYTGLAIEDVKEVTDKVVKELKKLPSTERRGRWIRDEFGSKCSSCGMYAYRDKYDEPWESPYCPICGANMRKGKEEEK